MRKNYGSPVNCMGSGLLVITWKIRWHRINIAWKLPATLLTILGIN
ncbi:hypothetical protein [Mucilaginibacter sp. NFX135]